MTTNWYAGEQMIHQHFLAEKGRRPSQPRNPRVARQHWWTRITALPSLRTPDHAVPASL